MSDKLLLLQASAAIQAAADEGKTPQVQILAYAGGIMRVPFWGDVAIDLKALDTSGQVPILVDHDPTLRGIAGHGAAAVEQNQLVVRGTIPPVSDAGRQVVELAKAGFQWQASVGVEPQKTERLEAGAKATLNGKTIQAARGPVTIIRRGKFEGNLPGRPGGRR